jgi:hypothetical protein
MLSIKGLNDGVIKTDSYSLVFMIHSWLITPASMRGLLSDPCQSECELCEGGMVFNSLIAIAQNQAVIEPKLLIFSSEKLPFCRILRYCH